MAGSTAFRHGASRLANLLCMLSTLSAYSEKVTYRLAKSIVKIPACTAFAVYILPPTSPERFTLRLCTKSLQSNLQELLRLQELPRMIVMVLRQCVVGKPTSAVSTNENPSLTTALYACSLSLRLYPLSYPQYLYGKSNDSLVGLKLLNQHPHGVLNSRQPLSSRTPCFLKNPWESSKFIFAIH